MVTVNTKIIATMLKLLPPLVFIITIQLHLIPITTTTIRNTIIIAIVNTVININKQNPSYQTNFCFSQVILHSSTNLITCKKKTIKSNRIGLSATTAGFPINKQNKFVQKQQPQQQQQQQPWTKNRTTTNHVVSKQKK